MQNKDKILSIKSKYINYFSWNSILNCRFIKCRRDCINNRYQCNNYPDWDPCLLKEVVVEVKVETGTEKKQKNRRKRRRNWNKNLRQPNR